MGAADRKKRESGIELLRILAMLLIILSHIPRFYAGGVDPLSASGLALALLTDAGRVAVNLFLLVGVWFMVDWEFKASRPLKLYLSVLGYAVPLTAVAWATGHGAGAGETLRCFFPLLGRPLWFVSAYLTLLSLTPFLRKVRDLPLPAFGRLVLLLSVFTCGVCTLPDPQLTYFGDTVWFVFVYLFMAWFRRSVLLPKAFAVRRLLLVVGLAGYAALVLLSVRPSAVSSFAGQCLFDFKTLPNFFVSLCLFLFFAGLKIGCVPWINALARPALAAYVVHQMPSFAPFLWACLFPVARYGVSPGLGGRLVLTALGVYALAAVLEALRVRLVEPLVIRSGGFKWLCARIEGFYAPVLARDGKERT